MFLVALCAAIPILLVALFLLVRAQYGSELFGLNWPPHELNRKDDHRLIKIDLDSPGR